jgi:glutamate 5-kinase
MRSKVVAAEMASAGGVATVIAHGARTAWWRRRSPATRRHALPADERAVSSFKLWIRYGRRRPGGSRSTRGAASALERDGGSLLPSASRGATGRFSDGDASRSPTRRASVFARGLAEQSAAEVRRGGPARREPAVHRDNLVLLRSYPI